jgi:uncharacterized protein (TIGR00369 family)
MQHRMSADDINAFWRAEFPQVVGEGRDFTVIAASAGAADVFMPYAEKLLRPGGTISGPSMFALADLAMYAAVLSAIGPVALALTVNLNINFLRRPAPAPMTGKARLHKLGSRLAYGEVTLYSEGADDAVAHATSTYSIPPQTR